MRGIHTSEFWAGMLGVALLVLVMMDGGGSDAKEIGLVGVVIIVSVYIAGRCLIKAVEALRGRSEARSAAAAKKGEDPAYTWRA